MITVQDIIPYFHIGDDMKSNLSPVGILTNLTYPLNAAVVFSGADNESTSMVLVENLSFSDGNKDINLQVTPIKSYDGERLKDFANAASLLDKSDINKAGSFSLYIEFKQKSLENS